MVGLALRLNRLPSELLRDATHADIVLLRAYYAVDPWGEHRADWRAAMQADTTWKAAGGRSSLEDFFPRIGPSEPVKLVTYSEGSAMLAGILCSPNSKIVGQAS